jgi:hypothetical protein
MPLTRSLHRFVPALACLSIGLAQLVWVLWLIGNSLHMGSPIRLHGSFVVRSIEDSTSRGRVEYQHQVGLLGFELLEYSMWVHVVFGVALVLLGGALLASRVLAKTTSIPGHTAVGGPN